MRDFNPEMNGIPRSLTMEAQDLQVLGMSLGNLNTRREKRRKMERKQEPETSADH